MRSVWTSVLGLACFGLVVATAAQAPQSQDRAYQNRCAGCHGSDMTGATGPSILTYVRYHVDKDIAVLLANGHHGVAAQMPEQELRQVLAEMRKLAGTNPAMATGGYTGMRGRWSTARNVPSVRASARRPRHRGPQANDTQNG